jgi:ribose transport system permease protein
MEKTSGLKKFIGGKQFTLIIVTVVIIILFYIIKHTYLSIDNIKTIFIQCSTSGIIAVGMSCLLISGQIDLSSGAIGMFSGLIVALLLATGMPWIVAVIITLAMAACIGLFNAFLANVLNFMSFISTLGVMTIISGLGNVITNAQTIAVSDKAFWGIGSIVLFGVFPLPFVIMVLVFIGYGFMLSSTKFGRRMYMCGGNRNAARLAGISPKKVTTILFANNGALAGLTGIIFTARMHGASSSSIMGTEMTGITAAVLGGVGFMGGSGGMLGAFIGLILLNSFTSGLVIAGLGAYWQIVASGVLLILALTLDYIREKSRIKALKTAAIAAAVKH